MQVILHRTDGVIVDLGTIVKDIRAGKGSAGKLIYDTELYDRANGLLKQADGVIAKVNDAADQAKLLVTDMRSNTGPMQGAIADLRRTLAGAGEAMSDLSENTEALKRNFFFKGFFERRGYYDLDDVPVAEYRKGALEGTDRRVVRVWLKADVLFAKDEQGQDVLTEDGKARVESAMSELLSLPKDSPIVIEGYAAAPTYDARYINSRNRASLVRDYLVNRLQLDRARMGVMPMGSEAPGSPANGTWDGVAIAIFLKTAK
jgi:phospholipid/cholesterol/gamma-HCH transport system substrate-binding protein